MPQITDSANIKNEGNKNYVTIALISSIKDYYRYLPLIPFAELIRGNEQYFLEKGKNAVAQILKTIKIMA